MNPAEIRTGTHTDKQSYNYKMRRRISHTFARRLKKKTKEKNPRPHTLDSADVNLRESESE